MQTPIQALARAERRIAVLEKALKPFALEAGSWAGCVSGSYHPGVTEPRQKQAYAKAEFTIGDCRNAARLLGIDWTAP